LPPPPVVEAPIIASVDTSGWYLRGDVGVGINQQSSLRSTFDPTVNVPAFNIDQHTIGDSAIIGVGVGYQLNNWFRGDLTGEYRSSAAVRTVESYSSAPFPVATCGIVGARCPDMYTGTIASAVFLANGYVDLGTWYGVTPFVGAGLGFARHSLGSTFDASIGNNGGGYSQPSAQTNFAWALMAGLGFNVNDRLKLEASYRYLDMGTITGNAIVCQPVGVTGCGLEQQSYKLASHDLRFGMRWMLGETSSGPIVAANAPLFGGPVSRPGPLIRKY
jgi:opacity protein-like surface antigen